MYRRRKFMRTMSVGIVLLSISGLIRALATSMPLTDFVMGLTAGIGLVLAVWSFYRMRRNKAY